MSKIGSIVLEIQDLVDEMGIENTVAYLTNEERKAVRANLNETIRTNSCETDCPHQAMLGLL